MADRTRPAEDTGVPDAEQMITVLTRTVARLIVVLTPGQFAASFREIATGERHVASHADVDAIEAWLTAHPPAR